MTKDAAASSSKPRRLRTPSLWRLRVFLVLVAPPAILLAIGFGGMLGLDVFTRTQAGVLADRALALETRRVGGQLFRCPPPPSWTVFVCLFAVLLHIFTLRR